MAAYAMNVPLSVPLTYIGAFGLGSILMRSAACTVNDVVDRKLDASVGMFFYGLGY